MSSLLHQLIELAADRQPDALAIKHRNASLSYAQLLDATHALAAHIVALRIGKQERVAVFLPKQPETVAALFGAAAAGCVFVPINPILKAQQVEHILRDCAVSMLITSSDRLAGLAEGLLRCPHLRHILLVGESAEGPPPLPQLRITRWREMLTSGARHRPHRVIDIDVASIFYTSGSTGKPKGVVLSHRNMVTGAHSVAQYLENHPSDRLLAVLPLSFDYGFSQLSTAFHVGASAVLMDHLFARDVVDTVAREEITGLAGVPPLWAQVADLSWPDAAKQSLRYITNSGGAMPAATLAKLRASLPQTRPYLMYGLTEAFRSTFLAPEEIDKRPGSMGKAIPNAEILVVRPDGTLCAPNEPGELVHRGSLVALGYWNDPEKTAERYKPAPKGKSELQLTEMAVWSGDTVKTDEDGFLYFVGRRDEMIKTSGYRVSPTEVEEVVTATGLVTDAIAVGITHPTLGQSIAVVVVAAHDKSRDPRAIIEACKQQLPAYMVPAHIEYRDSVPRNQNSKYDRLKVTQELEQLFGGSK